MQSFASSVARRGATGMLRSQASLARRLPRLQQQQRGFCNSWRRPYFYEWASKGPAESTVHHRVYTKRGISPFLLILACGGTYYLTKERMLENETRLRSEFELRLKERDENMRRIVHEELSKNYDIVVREGSAPGIN